MRVLLPERVNLGAFCVHHTTMHHVTSCVATYVKCMRVQLYPVPRAFGRMTGVFYVLLQWCSPVVWSLITRDYVKLFSYEPKLYGIARNKNGSLKKRRSKQILPRPCIASFKRNKQQQQGEHSTFHVLGLATESNCYNCVSCSPQQRFLLFLTKPKNKNGGEYQKSGSLLFSLVGHAASLYSHVLLRQH